MDGPGPVGYLAGKDDLADHRDHVGPIERDGRDAENGLGRIVAGQIEQAEQRGDETDQPHRIYRSPTPFVHRTP